MAWRSRPRARAAPNSDPRPLGAEREELAAGRAFTARTPASADRSRTDAGRRAERRRIFRKEGALRTDCAPLGAPSPSPFSARIFEVPDTGQARHPVQNLGRKKLRREINGAWLNNGAWLDETHATNNHSSFRDASAARGPGIHNPGRGYGFRVRRFAAPRNDGDLTP